MSGRARTSNGLVAAVELAGHEIQSTEVLYTGETLVKTAVPR